MKLLYKINKILEKKITFIFIIFQLTFFQSLMAQVSIPKNVPTPNVAAMETFGNIPVNLFTGTPDISIPLHTLKTGNIMVPIVLRYHPSAVKPSQQPGWVGLGWDLQCFGSITRKVNGSDDERYYESYPYPYYSESDWPDYQKTGAKRIEENDTWQNIGNYAVLGSEKGLADIQADEFNFNFFGHSGKFFYNGPVKGWIVESDENIKIELNSFISKNDLAIALDSYKSCENPNNNQCYNKFSFFNQIRFFGEFTLITDDGTRYTFGGKDGIEFTSPFYGNTWKKFSVSSWLLKSIKDINGKTVSFTYVKDYRNCDLTYYHENIDLINNYVCQGNDACSTNGNSSSTSMNLTTTHLTGSYLYPLYLSKIESDIESINFSNSIATTLRYTNNEYNIGQQNNTTNAHLWEINYDLTNLQTKKLDSFNVVDKINSKTIMDINFEYFENINQRFALKNLFFKPLNYNSAMKKYAFEYDRIESLPPYNGNYTDHWGYYNNINVNSSNGNLSYARQPSTTTFSIGMIKKMSYPTGEYAEFDWEGHKFSQVVNITRTGLEAPGTIDYAGGRRISEIRMINQGKLDSKKKYYYVKNYSNTSSVTSLTSSGVLNGKPNYSFTITHIPPYDQSINVYSVFPKINYSYAGNGSHIGYDEVVEVNLDTSYTKHFFTNFGADINNVTHYDNPPILFTSNTPEELKYRPFASLELERGKEIGTFDYNNQNILVKKTITTFRNDIDRFKSNFKQLEFSEYIKKIYPVIFFYGFEKYTYKYYPIKTETTLYDTSGNNPFVDSRFYFYNTKDQLIVEKTTTSKNNIVAFDKFYYPNDLISDSNMAKLVDANRIGLPVIKQSYKNDKKLFEEKTSYKLATIASQSIPMPEKSYMAKFPNQFPNVPNIGKLEPKLTYDLYDENGNITQFTTESGKSTTLIWGYKKSVLIAKIENAKYNDVQSYVSTLQTMTDTANQDELILITELNKLRTNLHNSFVTTYTYKPLIGVNTVTDPKGYIMSYYYDNFNRLSFVKDAQGNLISEYAYNYKNN